MDTSTCSMNLKVNHLCLLTRQIKAESALVTWKSILHKRQNIFVKKKNLWRFFSIKEICLSCFSLLSDMNAYMFLLVLSLYLYLTLAIPATGNQNFSKDSWAMYVCIYTCCNIDFYNLISSQFWMTHIWQKLFKFLGYVKDYTWNCVCVYMPTLLLFFPQIFNQEDKCVASAQPLGVIDKTAEKDFFVL